MHEPSCANLLTYLPEGLPPYTLHFYWFACLKVRHMLIPTRGTCSLVTHSVYIPDPVFLWTWCMSASDEYLDELTLASIDTPSRTFAASD